MSSYNQKSVIDLKGPQGNVFYLKMLIEDYVKATKISMPTLKTYSEHVEYIQKNMKYITLVNRWSTSRSTKSTNIFQTRYKINSWLRSHKYQISIFFFYFFVCEPNTPLFASELVRVRFPFFVFPRCFCRFRVENCCGILTQELLELLLKVDFCECILCDVMVLPIESP